MELLFLEWTLRDPRTETQDSLVLTEHQLTSAWVTSKKNRCCTSPKIEGENYNRGFETATTEWQLRPQNYKNKSRKIDLWSLYACKFRSWVKLVWGVPKNKHSSYVKHNKNNRSSIQCHLQITGGKASEQTFSAITQKEAKEDAKPWGKKASSHFPQQRARCADNSL